METWSLWDLDGCLSDCSLRMEALPDYERFHSLCGNDPVRGAEAALLRSWRWAEHRERRRVAILSGRTERWRGETDKWLLRNHLFGSVDRLLLRPNGDSRPSEVLKKGMVEDLMADKPSINIAFAVDDLPKIVRMYKSIGIPALQSIVYHAGAEELTLP